MRKRREREREKLKGDYDLKLTYIEEVYNAFGLGIMKKTIILFLKRTRKTTGGRDKE